MSQIPAPGLTPHDRRTVLDALVHAVAGLMDRNGACLHPGAATAGNCPACCERRDLIAEYNNLAARLRSGS